MGDSGLDALLNRQKAKEQNAKLRAQQRVAMQRAALAEEDESSD
eukprot:gene37439-31012_t